MAAITPGTITRESLGSLTLLIVSITTGSTSDTWTLTEPIPVVDFWCESHAGAAINDPDVTYTASTGVFLFTNAASMFGLMTLFILVRT